MFLHPHLACTNGQKQSADKTDDGDRNETMADQFGRNGNKGEY
ncbi:MAG: hypothetical protein O3A13_14025 [Proteobacteria bacterium]|nr:hypothetical protein [Pseudomonadota bacterium]